MATDSRNPSTSVLTPTPAACDYATADRSSELEDLRDFFDNAAIGLHRVDAQGLIIRVNKAELDLLGYPLEEYQGHYVGEFHEDPRVAAEMLERLSNGEVFHDYEARLRARDGSIKHVLIDSSARFIDGVFSHSRCLTREVTEQRRTERALHETEALYRSLVGALPALIVTTNPSGEIEDIDANYQAYTGLTLEQAKDWATHQVIHPHDLEQSTAMWGQAIATAEPMQNEMRLRRHDGVYRWYLVQAMPVRSASGEVLRWVTVNIDIDDRRRSEVHQQYLAETTAKLVSPLGSTDLLSEIARLAVPGLADICSIGLFDGTSQTARVDTAFGDESWRRVVEGIHLRGWRASPDSDETIGAHIAGGRDVFVPDASASWIEHCAPDETQRNAASELEPNSIVCVPLLARGETIGMATFATARSGRRYTERDRALLNEVAARLSIALENLQLYDELRGAAEQLLEANAAKDEFLGLVSHELRTPLTAIKGNAEVLLRRFDRLEEDIREQALRDIAAGSDRLESIIDNLLLLARLEQGQELEREPLVVVRVVEQVIARHQKLNPKRRFRVNESDRRRPVAFPVGCLEQVIENLISNAEKYSPADEAITIEINRTDADVFIRVLDRGRGLGPDAEHLFEPFYRSGQTSHSAPGLGIGLAVCKRLVDAVGGEIWAKGREGGGAEFGFSLPVIAESDD